VQAIIALRTHHDLRRIDRLESALVRNDLEAVASRQIADRGVVWLSRGESENHPRFRKAPG